jgi:hypothetical protein
MQLGLLTNENMRPFIRFSFLDGTERQDLVFDFTQLYTIPINTWSHICLIRNTYTFYFYVNGTLLGVVSLDNDRLIYPILDGSYIAENFQLFLPQNNVYESAEIYNFEIYDGIKYPVPQTIAISEAVPSDLTNYLLVLNGIKSLLGGGEVQNGQTLGTWAPNVINNNIILSDFNGNTYSTVCFVAGTRVLTDSGYISIECIDYNTHEIFGKKIIAVTKTVTPETHLACVSKNALSPGVPDRDTIMTLNHKIKFNGILTEVYQFVNLLPGISLVKYNQEQLFNVLLENHDVMIVNNMIVETLDPENLLAKMFIKMKELSLADRETLINMYNDYIKEKFQDSIKILTVKYL